MHRLTLLIILGLASTTFAQSARLIKHGVPVAATIEGYDKGHCMTAPTNIRICKLLSDDKDTFLVQKDGKSVGTWPGNASLGETSDFEVLTGDLDNDRKPELIVANHDGTSNGLGVDYWTIFIFPDLEFRHFAAPLTFSVEEFGSFGTFVTSGGRVNILTTSWVSNKDPKRGTWGTYLVGQWWRYQSGELRPLLDRPIIARRYLFSFERERGNTVKRDRVPFQWLSHKGTQSVNTEFITKRVTKSKTGIIEAVTREKESVRIVFKPDGEQRITFVYPGTYQDNQQLDYFGDPATGRLYPKNYLLSQPETWLQNKRATFRSYEEDGPHVLWLEPNRKQ
jgi:hypothetical protein